ncbi:MAG: cadherin-like beta sandwich domain-containing protein, partial [Clostridia bacterium]
MFNASPNSRTLRMWMICMLLVIIGAGQLYPVSVNAAPGGVQLVIAPIQGGVGQQVDVPVSIAAPATGVAAYGMQIDFDPDVLEAVSVHPANGEATECTSDTSGCFQFKMDQVSGWVRVGWFDLTGGDQPIRDAAQLFTLRFTIKKELVSGSKPLSIQASDPEKLNMTDLNGHNLYTSVTVMKAGMANLTGLSTTTGDLTPSFSPGVTSYKQKVGNSVTTTKVTALAYDAQATITINGEPVDSGMESSPIRLEVGDNLISVIVTGAAGETQTYTITIAREGSLVIPAALDDLKVTEGELSPAFDPETHHYTVEVEHEIDRIGVIATANQPQAIVEINGEKVESGTKSSPIDLTVGKNEINVTVTGGSGDTQTYGITVTRAEKEAVSPGLTGLELSEGSLRPAFSPERHSYTAKVGYEIEQITVTPTTDDKTASVTVNGREATSGEPSQPISLEIGDNEVVVAVISAEGKTQTYTITVMREEKQQPVLLNNLELSSGRLTPSFVPNRHAYSAVVSHEVEQITVIPTTVDETVTVAVNGEQVASGEESQMIDLAMGDNPIVVEASSAEGEKQVYTITVTREEEQAVSADLSGLTVSEGRLRPSFDPDRTEYEVEVEHDVKSIAVTPTAVDEQATIKVDGKSVTSGEESDPIALSVGSNRIKVKVSTDSDLKKTYEITVTRLKKDSDEPGKDKDEDNDKSSGNGGSGGRGGSSGNTAGGQSSGQLVTKSDEANGETTTLTVNGDELKNVLRQIEQNGTITLSTERDANRVIGVLNGQMVKVMEQKGVLLQIKTNNSTYTIPAEQINIDDLADQLGTQVQLDDIEIKVEISRATNETNALLQKNAQTKGYELVVPPVEFTITWSHRNEQGEIKSFHAFVNRRIALPDGVNPKQITTALRLNPDGSTTHVPTKIVSEDGRYYAEISSLTNSAYTVVWHPKSFADVEQHWAKEDINEMASRMVIAGVDEGHFAPGRSITRAEFAAIVVQALG